MGASGTRVRTERSRPHDLDEFTLLLSSSFNLCFECVDARAELFEATLGITDFGSSFVRSCLCVDESLAGRVEIARRIGSSDALPTHLNRQDNRDQDHEVCNASARHSRTRFATRHPRTVRRERGEVEEGPRNQPAAWAIRRLALLPFAEAYVVVHESGHHVHHRLGTDRQVGESAGSVDAELERMASSNAVAPIRNGSRSSSGGSMSDPNRASASIPR